MVISSWRGRACPACSAGGRSGYWARARADVPLLPSRWHAGDDRAAHAASPGATKQVPDAAADDLIRFEARQPAPHLSGANPCAARPVGAALVRARHGCPNSADTYREHLQKNVSSLARSGQFLSIRSPALPRRIATISELTSPRARADRYQGGGQARDTGRPAPAFLYWVSKA